MLLYALVVYDMCFCVLSVCFVVMLFVCVLYVGCVFLFGVRGWVLLVCCVVLFSLLCELVLYDMLFLCCFVYVAVCVGSV